MPPTLQYVFDLFRLEPSNARLWREGQLLRLTPKAFSVLAHLVTRPDQLVTKQDLLERVWSGTVVSDSALKTCIRELRQVLGDSARAPCFIATVQRRGYRFIAPVTVIAHSPGRLENPPLTPLASAAPSRLQTMSASSLDDSYPIVGRASELAQLDQRLGRARQGDRQVLFITGEAGIGKTALVDAFIGQLAADPSVAVTCGQCIEHYGPGESYMPILEALGRLCRLPIGPHVVTHLRQYAPTWLAQMPWLLSIEDREALQRELVGATARRMVRELIEAMEALSAKTLLVMVLEDLHWSDAATLELLAAWAQRREPAPVVFLTTYRSTEAMAPDHPLHAVKQTLQQHGQCAELPLGPLSASEVATYLVTRLPGCSPSDKLTLALYERTEGHPFFLQNVIDTLMLQGLIAKRNGKWEVTAEANVVEVGVPASVRQMLERQITPLPPIAHRLLEAASVAGICFAAATVAAGLGMDVVEVEAACEALARRQQVLQPAELVEWWDGEATPRYRFRHWLHQQVWYERVGPMRRVQLHRCFGVHLEAVYGTRSDDMAAELAVHFTRGRAYPQALYYLRQAAANASRRHAPQEAIGHLKTAIELLQHLPNGSSRQRCELPLQTALGTSLMAAKGYAAPDVRLAYERANELCQQLGETTERFPALRGLAAFHYVRADYSTAQTLAEQCLKLAQHERNAMYRLEAHSALGSALFFLGQFSACCGHFERGMALYDPAAGRTHAYTIGQDPGMGCLSYSALALWLRGYPAQAAQRNAAALALGEEIGHPFSRARSLTWAAILAQFRQDWRMSQSWAQDAVELSMVQGFPIYAAAGAILYGYGEVVQGHKSEGLAQIRQGLKELQTMGAQSLRPYFFALQADAYRRLGRVEEGLQMATAAIAEATRTKEAFYEAELHRLHGELLLAQTPDNPTGAKACFHRSLSIACRQHATSWELRAAVSLGRLYQRQGQRWSAYQLLAAVYNRFTEGFDMADLCEAKALLDDFGR